MNDPKPTEPSGKNHCGMSADGTGDCELGDVDAQDRCACGCSRCGPWNDYRDELDAWKKRHPEVK